MFDALRKRIREIETAHKAIPKAAIAIANKLRADVRKGRAKATRKRKGSGIPILVVAEGDLVRITGSDQVHFFARENDEPETWLDIFGRTIVRAARGL